MEPVLEMASDVVNNASLAVNTLHGQLKKLDDTVKDLRSKIQFIILASNNETTLISEGRNKGESTQRVL